MRQSPVPYPTPTSASASAVMRGNRRVNTTPELQLRSTLHRLGLRFRKDYLVRVGHTRVHVDIAFPSEHLVVFVDGCFWHVCPKHGNVPTSNPEYWEAKLARNVTRDRSNTRALRRHGWSVLRIWEHTPPEAAARRVERKVQELRERG